MRIDPYQQAQELSVAGTTSERARREVQNQIKLLDREIADWREFAQKGPAARRQAEARIAALDEKRRRLQARLNAPQNWQRVEQARGDLEQLENKRTVLERQIGEASALRASARTETARQRWDREVERLIALRDKLDSEIDRARQRLYDANEIYMRGELYQPKFARSIDDLKPEEQS